MRKDELIKELESQLTVLKREGEFEVFEVIDFDVWIEPDGIDPIRIVKNTWEWGSCTSETCSHYSHDPYSQGDTVWILCKHIGISEDGYALYVTPDGVTFEYMNDQIEGRHYAPDARIRIVETK